MSITPDGDSGRPKAADDPGRDLCARFVDALPIDGASISVVTEQGGHSTIGASDAVAARLEARQFELGVGPHWDALRTERPAILYEATADDVAVFWPRVVGDALRGDAGALFAFPLQLGAATVGVADLYSRSTPKPWSNELIRRAREVAALLATTAVRLATRSADAATSATGGYAVELRREVHQATGMVMAQLGCTASTALLRLRGRAFASGVPLDTIARDVTAQRLDFADL